MADRPLTSAGMGARRRLERVASQLMEAREELAAAEAQLAFFADEADDWRVRGLVSDNALDRRTADETVRTADNARRHRDRVAAEVARLRAEVDDLLSDPTEKGPS